MTTTYLSGTTSGNSIDDGDSLIVTNGGVDEAYTVTSGGLLVVESGGLALNGFIQDLRYGAIPSVDMEVYSGGVASGTAVFGGGQVIAGGTSYAVTIADGEQIVSNGGVAYNTIMSGPSLAEESAYSEEQLVVGGGQAVGTIVRANFEAFVDGVSYIPEEQVVGSGGTATGTTISGDVTDYFDGEGFQLVFAPADMYVSSGGTASNADISLAGEEYVSSGGIIAGTTVITGYTLDSVYNGDVTSGGTLVLNGLAGSGLIDFEGPGELIISGVTMPTNQITHITPNAVIDLASIPEDTVTRVKATDDQLIIETTNGEKVLNIDGADTREYVISDGQDGGTELLCYLKGSRILTPTGERLIEDLRIGDVVVTRYNGLQKIRWIGCQSYSSRFLYGKSYKMPIRIQAGALGKDLPARDLLVSPGHSMLLTTEAAEERLVLASALINGITITQDEVPDEVHYFQLDLPHHDCIIAEGTWSETYGDGDQLRGQFHNVADFYQLYPEHREPDELVLCAPRPMIGPKLDQALRPIVTRAMAGITPGPLSGCIDLMPTPWKVEGWAHDAEHPDLPVLLEVLLHDASIGTVLACDYRSDLEQAGIGRGRCAFVFPSPIRLAADTMHKIRVRRLSDGAEITMSDACRAQIDKDSAIATGRQAGLRRVRPLIQSQNSILAKDFSCANVARSPRGCGPDAGQARASAPD